MQLTAVNETTDFDTARCGTDIGCYLEPLKCIHALDTCDYVLTWHAESVSVRFNLTARMYHRVLWMAVGLNDEQQMVGRYDIFLLSCLFATLVIVLT